MTRLRRLLDHLGNAIGTWLPVDDYSAKMHASTRIPTSTATANGTCTPCGTGRPYSRRLRSAPWGEVPSSDSAVGVKALPAGNPAIMAFVFGPFTAGAGLLWWHRLPAAGWVLIAPGTAVGLRYLVAGW